MLTIKGFCTRRLQADNSPNKVATFGELSTYARTFTKDIGIYSNTTYPEVELNIFSHKLDGVDNGVLAIAFIDSIISVTNWIYAKSLTINSDINKQEYLTDMSNNFFGQFTNLNIGLIKNAEGRTIPEWFSFSLTSHPSNEVKIWLSSVAFERDYDEYEITVVSPLLTVDTMFRPVSEIRTVLASVSMTDMLEKVQNAKNKSPETVLRAENIQYIHPADPAITIDTTWYVLVYGPAGNNSEAIKNALIEYILANSGEPETAWKQIFPFLFKVTRMYILPKWENMAIPNRLSVAGIYSPIAGTKDSLTYAKAALPFLANTFVEDNLEITHHKYRSITLLCCGDADNAQNLFKLSDYVPDYIAESSNTQDFNRMSENTKHWTVMMEELLIIAENYTDFSQLPANTRKLELNGVKYIGRRLGRIEYLVASKEVT